ncbi:MAG: PLP-dependent aminotransferase family protein [Ruminococcaceae bacterium]|nr:PLP-dependent aminotransferase family protein [Oscillospiraceae bacterium]
MEFMFSNKVKDMKPSAIREIFKSLSDPNVISFAAGNPSPLSFPVEKMKDVADEIFATQASVAFQYGITEGYPRLREQIKTRLRERFNTGTDDDELIITTGGQQGIDLCAKVLCNEGDTVICENPSFIGALNAFRSYNTNLVGVDLEDDGINIEALENALKANPNTKIIYVIPTFQNPAGITTSLEKRKAILDLAKKYNVLILEDNPYGELRFAGEDVPTIKSLDTDGRVLYCSSFSKILSAGMRIGFVCGPKELVQKIVVVKQVNDVHTNQFFQMVASKFIDKYGLDEHIDFIRGLYRDKCNLMLSELDKQVGDKARYTRPEGGLFIWLTVDGANGDELAKRAIENKVAVVTGSSFNPIQGGYSPSIRLNYSTPSDEQIIEGVKRLASIL